MLTLQILNNIISVNKKSGQKLFCPLSIKSTSKDAMKLRMTGFERSPSFVIRLGNKPPQINEDGARHQTAKLVSVFHKNLMSFPINFDVVFFISNSLVLFL